MEVLIVSKTHMGGAACVGGLVLDTNQSVRLLQPGLYCNPPANTDYEIGGVWELAFTPRKDPTPPHVEDIIVTQRNYLREQPDLLQFLQRRLTPWSGSSAKLYDGLICPTYSGSGFIARSSGVPKMSTGYWLPDAPLLRIDEARSRYRYTGRNSGIQVIPYVGFSPPIETIPAGTLVRVSLARWWHPEDAVDMEERCYVQLSGWYL